MYAIRSYYDGYFPHLPHLKEIILYNEEDSTSIGSDFFTLNPDLESLTIINESEGNIDWNSLNTLKSLQSLYIESDSIILNDIYKYHVITSYSIHYTKLYDFSTIDPILFGL